MKTTKVNWLEAFRMMRESPNKCFMRFGMGCVYKIACNKLYVWSTNPDCWSISQESVCNFSQCEWDQVEDPSNKWVKCTNKELWNWILAKWAKGEYQARFRSLNANGKVRVPWVVGEIQHMDPTMWIINGELQHEYLDQ